MTRIDLLGLAQTQPAEDEKSDLYLLIDHAGMPGLLRRLDLRVKWLSLFEGSKDEGALLAAPILIQFTSGDRRLISSALIKWITENAAFSSSLLVLSSPLPLVELRSRLSFRLAVTLSDGVDAMLRFYDPRVFEAMTSTLTEDQLTRFLSPAHTWWYVDRAALFHKVTGQFEPDELLDERLQLESEQEFALLDASEVDQVIDLLQQNMSELETLLPAQERHQVLKSQLRAAHEQGICSLTDLVMYIANALTAGRPDLGRPATP